jgi:hypothetical protein
MRRRAYRKHRPNRRRPTPVITPFGPPRHHARHLKRIPTLTWLPERPPGQLGTVGSFANSAEAQPIHVGPRLRLASRVVAAPLEVVSRELIPARRECFGGAQGRPLAGDDPACPSDVATIRTPWLETPVNVGILARGQPRGAGHQGYCGAVSAAACARAAHRPLMTSRPSSTRPTANAPRTQGRNRSPGRGRRVPGRQPFRRRDRRPTTWDRGRSVMSRLRGRAHERTYDVN